MIFALSMRPTGSSAPIPDQSLTPARIQYFPPAGWWPLWSGDRGKYRLRERVRRAHPLSMSESGLVWFVMASADSECGDVV